ncbi:MAG: hypothetical protein J5846_11375 [Desulfovibrio sp.]|nr:hypothetical protein [Desulfovibrio sp.]
MIELTGTLKERLDTAIYLTYTNVSEAELEHFRYIYKKAQIPLLPAAEEFYRQYGGVLKNYYIVLTNSEFNREIYLYFYANISVSEKESLTRLQDAMLDLDSVRAYAKQKICPVADIGYYYPAVVYVGQNGLLYCTYDFKDEIEVFRKPSEILEAYLKNNMPIGIDEMPIKTVKPESKKIYGIKTKDFSMEFEPLDIKKLHLKNEEKLRVKIRSYGFAVNTILNINTSILKDFAIELHKFYETLTGKVELEELRGHSRFTFNCTTCGQICVFISIEHKYEGKGHEMTCANSFDQTFLKDFAQDLFADYGK